MVLSEISWWEYQASKFLLKEENIFTISYICLIDNERKKKLEKLYNNWQQRIGPLSTEISEDQLDLLKQSSRLVHHVATPLLLSPYWRDKAMNLPRNLEDIQRMEAEKASGGVSSPMFAHICRDSNLYAIF